MVVGCWHDCLSTVRCRLAYGPADATATHCLLLAVKSRLVLHFWYRLIQVVPEKGLLNRCMYCIFSCKHDDIVNFTLETHTATVPKLITMYWQFSTSTAISHITRVICLRSTNTIIYQTTAKMMTMMKRGGRHFKNCAATKL